MSLDASDARPFRAFVAREIAPHADRFEREQAIDGAVVRALAREGYLGAAVPAHLGGAPLDPVAFGELNAEVGRACSSVRSLITVHSMVCTALARWGTAEQRRRWLPELAAGRTIAAFALTEPQAGSDIERIETRATRRHGHYVLDGRKCWISFAQIADVILVFSRIDGQAAAFLVDRDTPGLSVRPVADMLGLRASMLAELNFADCAIPQDRLIGRAGFGLSAVAASALDVGRYSVAWGCVGIAEACLEASLGHALARRQFGASLASHQLIKRRLAEMAADVKTARLLCRHAGTLRAAGRPESVMETCLAKYVAARACVEAASAAVQIHGAIGCSAESPVGRYFRDAKIMEIIEGSTEMQQLLIADYEIAAYEHRDATDRARRHAGDHAEIAG